MNYTFRLTQGPLDEASMAALVLYLDDRVNELGACEVCVGIDTMTIYFGRRPNDDLLKNLGNCGFEVVV